MRCELETLRTQKGLSLRSLADLASVAPSTISRAESGEDITLSVAQKISSVMEKSIDEIWPTEVRTIESTVTVRRVVE